MKNLMVLIASAGLLAACGTSFCRQNMCASCDNVAVAAPVEETAPEPVKEEPQPEPVPQIDTSKPFTLGATTFKYNAFDFTEEAKANLDDLAAYLNAYPDKTITVEGHTDSVGSAVSNQILSEKRANAVKEYLVSAGVGAERITTKGSGHKKPIASNATREGRAKNRRIEITFGK